MTQNRSKLLYVEGFEIGGCSIYSTDTEMLGSFNSRERAQEVLFEIMDRLEDGMKLQEDAGGQVFTRHMVWEVPIK